MTTLHVVDHRDKCSGIEECEKCGRPICSGCILFRDNKKLCPICGEPDVWNNNNIALLDIPIKEWNKEKNNIH